MKTLALNQIAFDAGTQIRAAIDQQVVADYAEAMTNGATFPPVVVFHDSTTYYLADGFHRFLAAQRNNWREIDADVRPGTKEEALWFALGANKANGQRMTVADKKHAILLALKTWPERSANQIAEQIGVNAGYLSRIKAQHNVNTTPDSRVVGRDGKSYPASSPKPSRPESSVRIAVRAMVEEGKSATEIRASLGAATGTIASVRKELGLTAIDNSREAVQQRRQRMREMAGAGYTSRQIAADLELTEIGCRKILRTEGIEVPADKMTRGTHHHDSNRILGQIVMDAENLTEGVNLIDFDAIDKSQLVDWLKSLMTSRDKLGAFIRRLMKEQQKHGEAA